MTVEKSVAGRDQEFEDAFDDLHRVAMRAALRVLRDEGAAADVVAEALVRAYVRWARIAPYASAWVARVATNLAIDGWRERRRPLPDRSRTTPDHSSCVAASVDLGIVLRALPRRQREAVMLRHLIDLPETAVAAAMGCSVGAVKQHTARGLAAMRDRLGNGEE